MPFWIYAFRFLIAPASNRKSAIENRFVSTETPAPAHRFGEVALAMGLVTPQQLEEGLKRQQELRGGGAKSRLGETFILMKLLSVEQVREVLSEQRKWRQFDANQKLPAEQLGEYKLTRRIGEGGMGIVFEAKNVLTGQTVALKVLRKGLGVDHTYIERFQRELSAAGKLAHPNLVATLDCGLMKGVQYLAMEFIEGETLKTAMALDGKVEEKRALAIARDVAKALAHAHKAGYIHRDVKPENVLLARDGTVKLADLGLAKSVYGDSQLTKTGEVVGTPYYISPEQALGEKNIDARADLYALGATLYHALTGHLPFQAGTPLDVMLLHIKAKLPNPRDLNPALSDAAVQIVTRLLAKAPEDRYANAELLAADLDAVLRGEAPQHAALDVNRSTILPPQHFKRAEKAKGAGCLGVLAVVAVAWALL